MSKVFAQKGCFFSQGILNKAFFRNLNVAKMIVPTPLYSQISFKTA